MVINLSDSSTRPACVEAFKAVRGIQFRVCLLQILRSELSVFRFHPIGNQLEVVVAENAVLQFRMSRFPRLKLCNHLIQRRDLLRSFRARGIWSRLWLLF